MAYQLPIVQMKLLLLIPACIPMNKDSLPPAGKRSRRKWSLRRQLTTEGLLRSRKSPDILLQQSQMESCQVCRRQPAEMFIVGDHRRSCTINIPVPRRCVPVDGPACEQPPGNVGSLSLWHSPCVSICTVLHEEHPPASFTTKHRRYCWHHVIWSQVLPQADSFAAQDHCAGSSQLLVNVPFTG